MICVVAQFGPLHMAAYGGWGDGFLQVLWACGSRVCIHLSMSLMFWINDKGEVWVVGLWPRGA